MKNNFAKSAALGGLLVLCASVALTGCRIKPEDAASTSGAEILYQTYCEDSYKGYQLDNTAALTFYEDGTYSIGHCSGLNKYEMCTGTWTVDNGVLSLYNEDGELVGNGKNTNLNDRNTWAQWGMNHYDNSDGTFTDYYNTYAFDTSENGDFILTVDDETYYYWGQNGHIRSDYVHTFTADEFVAAYNSAGIGGTLSSVTLNQGTASPLNYYQSGVE